MYRYHTPSGDKSCDGMAMALRAGLPLRDMEMVQFHPTGLLAGEGTRMTGTVLEEGLRGSGGYLTDAQRRALHVRLRPARRARHPRHRQPLDHGSHPQRPRVSPHGGVYIEMGHLGPDRVRREFKGMVERCADCGFDLAAGRVEVIPTAHYMMGGVVFNADCTTPLPRLYAAGEDTGGVHGANRLGGNGVANSTVFGGIAGDIMGARTKRAGALPDPDTAAIDARLRARLRAARPQSAAICRRCASGSTTSCGTTSASCVTRRDSRAARRRSMRLARDIAACGVADASRRYNLTWMDRLNLENLTLVSRAIAAAADFRRDSRGAHFREDFPHVSELAASAYTSVRLVGRPAAGQQREGRLHPRAAGGVDREGGLGCRRAFCQGAPPRLAGNRRGRTDFVSHGPGALSGGVVHRLAQACADVIGKPARFSSDHF